jgi:transcriptional regulator with XRE-family HTH domain
MPEPHPAKGVLATRRITNKRVAGLYGCSPLYVGRVLNGYEKPPKRFRAFLSELLGMPEDDLFHEEEVLAGGGVS